MKDLSPPSIIQDAPGVKGDELLPESTISSLHSLSDDEINWLRRAVIEGGSAHRIPREYVPSARVAKVLEPGLYDERHVPPGVEEIQVELGRIIKGIAYEWALRKMEGTDPPPVIDGTSFDEEFQEELFSRIRLRIGNGSRFFNLLYMDMKDAMRTGAAIDGSWGKLEWHGKQLRVSIDPHYHRTVREKLGDLFPT